MIVKMLNGNESEISDRLGRRVKIVSETPLKNYNEAWWPGEVMQQGEAYNRGIDLRTRKEINQFLNE